MTSDQAIRFVFQFSEDDGAGGWADWQPLMNLASEANPFSEVRQDNLTLVKNTRFRIYYTTNTSAGSTPNTPWNTQVITVTVNQLPLNTPIGFTTSIICQTYTTTFSDATSGGVWTSTNSSIANITESGLITGLSQGSSLIKYIVTDLTTGCVSIEGKSITVNPTPSITSFIDAVCSERNYSKIPTTPNFVPSGTTFNWLMPTTNAVNVGDLTGMAAAATTTQPTINAVLTNHTIDDIVATYTITATKGTCASPPFNLILTVPPTPVISSKSLESCSGTTLNYTPPNNGTDIVPINTTYSWDAPQSVLGISGTGMSSRSAQNSISLNLVNSTNAPINVVYNVTTLSVNCTGTTFTLTVKVNPKPQVATITDKICSGGSFDKLPLDGGSNIVPTETVYTWNNPITSGITGTLTGTSQNSIFGTSTNTTDRPIDIVYNVYPRTSPLLGSCLGNPFTVNITVDPVPIISNRLTGTQVGSGSAFNFTIDNLGSDIIPSSPSSNTTYSWLAPTVSSDITGQSANTNQLTLIGTLNNALMTPITVTYIITPTFDGCSGAAFNYPLAVYPRPIIHPQSRTNYCSGEGNFLVTPTDGVLGDVVPTGTYLTWPLPVASGITGLAAGTGSSTYSVSGTLINTTNFPIVVTYVVTPQSGAQIGDPFNVTITVNPLPAATLNAIETSGLTNNDGTICSDGIASLTISPTNGVVTDFDYTWTVPASALNPGNTYLLNTVNANDYAGSYSVSMTNKLTGCVNASPATKTIIIKQIPTVAAPTSANSICAGLSIPLTAQVLTGTGNYTSYKWYTTVSTTTTIASSTVTSTLNVTGAAPGSADLTYTVTDNFGCNSVLSAPKSIIVYALPLDPTVNPVNVVYDGLAHEVVATVGAAPVGNDVIEWYANPTGGLSISPVPNRTNYGASPNYYAQAINTTTGCINTLRKNTNVTISKATLTITANPHTIIYNANSYSGGNGVTLLGFVNNETISVLSGTLTYTGSSQGAKNIGTYYIVPAGYVANNDNYNINFVSGILTINAKSLTISGTIVSDKVYDATDVATLTNATLVGVANPDLANVTLTAIGHFPNKNIGINLSVTSTSIISGTASGNYTLTAQPIGLTASIFKKDIKEINGVTANKIYDATNKAILTNATLMTAEAAGTPNSSSDYKPYLLDNITLTPSAIYTGIRVGTHSVTSTSTLIGVDANNYQLINQTGLTPRNITVKSLTMSGLLVPPSKIYDGNVDAVITGSPGILKTPEAVNTGDAADGTPYIGDVVGLTGSAIGVYNSKDVSNASSISFSNVFLTGSEAGNYSLTIQSPSNAIITKKALTFTGLSVPISKVYNGNKIAIVSGSPGILQAAEVTNTGNVTDGKPYTGDFVSIQGPANGTYNTKDVLTATTVSFTGLTLTGAQAANYSLTAHADAAATITAKPISITGATAANKIYDAIVKATITGGSLVGVVSPDDVLLTQSGNFSNKEVGTNITITATCTISGIDATNYSLTQPVIASKNITRKNLEMFGLSIPTSKTYNATRVAVVSDLKSLYSSEAPGSGTVVDGNPYTGDDVSLTGTPVGTYNTKDVATANLVTFTNITLVGAQSGNYSLTIQAPTAATINQKELTISGLSVPLSKVYDGNRVAAIIGSATLQGAEVVSTGNANDGKPYSIDAVSITGTPIGTYNTKDVLTANRVIFSNLSLSGAQSTNYSLKSHADAAAIITQKTITTSGVTTSNKIYDATNVATLTGGALVGVVSPDDVVLDRIGTFSGIDVANNISINSACTLVGIDAPNYSLTQPVMTANITVKNLTMLGLNIPASKIYDATTVAFITDVRSLNTPQAPGIGTSTDGNPYTGDGLSLIGTPIGTYNSKDVATATKVTFTGITLSGVKSGNYSLTIQPSTPATITPKELTMVGLSVAGSKVYDGNKNALVLGTAALQPKEAPGTGLSADGKPYDGDNIIITGTPIATYNNKNVVGATIVKFTGLQIDGTDVLNYSFKVQGDYQATIIPLVIKLTADRQTKEYGELDPSLYTYVNEPIIPGDSFSGSLARDKGENVGSYAIVKSTIDLGTNYTINYVFDSLIITEAPMFIKPDVTERVYGDQPLVDGLKTTNFVATGLKFGETIGAVKLFFTKGPGSGNNLKDTVGLYVIKVSAKEPSGGTALVSNYKIVSFPGDLNVSKCPISIKADPKTKRQDQIDPSLTYTISHDLVIGDTLSGALDRVKGETPGTYQINQGSLAINANYDIKYISDALTILTVENIFVVPNAFTPNGDGLNDKIKILYNSSIIGITYFNIYNRAGKLVFQTHDIEEGWDGTFGSIIQESDAYFWTAEFETWNHLKIKQKGTFVLLK